MLEQYIFAVFTWLSLYAGAPLPAWAYPEADPRGGPVSPWVQAPPAGHVSVCTQVYRGGDL